MCSKQANRSKKAERLNKTGVYGITGDQLSRSTSSEGALILEEHGKTEQKRRETSEEIIERTLERRMYVDHI